MDTLALYKQLGSGNKTVTDGAAGPVAVLAAVTGRTIIVMGAVLNVTTAATGGSGVVNILDGTTVLASFEADASGYYPIDFGNRGYPLTQGNAFQVSVTSAVTTQASANILAWGLVSA